MAKKRKIIYLKIYYNKDTHKKPKQKKAKK